jgi:hypothetical protein
MGRMHAYQLVNRFYELLGRDVAVSVLKPLMDDAAYSVEPF